MIFGVEVEYIFPFNNNKWSSFIDPSYLSYNYNGRIKIGAITSNVISAGGTVTTPIYEEGTLEYKSIEIPAGIRHYFFINQTSSLFVNSGLIISLPLNESLIKERKTQMSVDEEIDKLETNFNYFIGFGYNFNKKYSIELRYNSPNYLASYGELNNVSLKFGYNFL